MAKRQIAVGSTSNILDVFIQDSASTTGGGKTGLTATTTSLLCSYKRNTGGAAVDVTLTAQATLGSYDAAGLKEIDSTKMPGAYEFCPPDAAFATGASSVLFYFRPATTTVAAVSLPLEIELTGFNVQASGVIVNSYGTTTAQPLQPTVAGRTLDVAATGEAGLDFDNINQASSATTLQLITVPVVGQVNNAVDVSSLNASIYTNLLGQHYLYGDSFNNPVVTADTVTLNGETGANDNCIVGCIFLVRDSTGLLKLVRRVKAYDFATNTVTVDEPWGVNVPLDNDLWEVRALAPIINEAVNAYSAKELLRIISAVLAGKSTGAMAGVGTIVFRDTADTKDVVTSGFDADGNRTSVTVDPS